MSTPQIQVHDSSRGFGGLPGGFRPTLRVDTPDPNGYTDLRAANVFMEGESVAGRPMRTLVPRGRGTIIPRATRDGASRGVDHYAPQVINVDPHIGGGVTVDLSALDAQALGEAVEQANYENSDPAEAAYAAYARVADPSAQPHPDNRAVLMSPGELSRPAPGARALQVPHSAQGTIYGQPYGYQGGERDDRSPPLQMPGAYVVPRAAPGGGQVAAAYEQSPRPAPPPPPNPQQLRGRQPPPGARRAPRQIEQAEPEPYEAYAPAEAPPPRQAVPASFAAAPATAEPVRRIRGPLREAFQEQEQAVPQPPPLSRMRQVTFELPGGGQFECLYSDVLVQKTCLVLVLDHRHFLQMKYFPPMADEPIAVFVQAQGREPQRLLLCHTTGMRFQDGPKEYCVLLVEQEKEMNGEPVEA